MSGDGVGRSEWRTTGSPATARIEKGADALNFILVMSDSLRRDHVSAYSNQLEEWPSGGRWPVQTPNLDRFADRAALFQDFYVGSFPTVLNRRELHTGRSVFTFGEWEALPEDETTMSQVLTAAGYNTMLVADTPHIFRRGFNYERGFTGFEWIRGQENDGHFTDPPDVPVSFAENKMRSNLASFQTHGRNAAHRVQEADHSCPRTFRTAAEWLERNHANGPFCLVVDTFDPHEPWDAPDWYTDKYDPDYKGESISFPKYDYWENFLSPEELRHCHALYCGEVSLVDRWFGEILETVDSLNLWDDTAIVFMSDHGYYFGEYGLIGKAIMMEEAPAHPFPLHPAVNHLPLIVHIPGMTSAGQQVNGFVQPQDFMPALLELAGAEDPGTMHGKSFVPLVRGEAGQVRPAAISSHSIVAPVAGRPSTIVTEEWTLIMGAPVTDATPARTEGMPGGTGVNVLGPQRGPLRPEEPGEYAVAPHLYRTVEDPHHAEDVIADHPDVARELQALLIEYLESINTDEKYIAPRRAMRFE